MTTSRLLLEAAHLAGDRHRDQHRKDRDATPYINHPLADAEVLAAALLHDTVEDTETSIEEIEQRFGSRIAGIVAEVTDDRGRSRA